MPTTKWTPERLAEMREAFGKSYQIAHEVTPTGLRTAIVCLYCGKASYNRHDIEQKYCGACHRFHEPERP